ncbi:MAG: hypothetical protein J0H55_15525 [Chitinophagaceae bacterium]|nr:hypothetical protein [Chitinophagaceae bacterium]
MKEGWLIDFFKEINFKKGRATDVTVLTIKLAVIVWNNLSRQYGMVVKGQSYNPPTQ